MAKRTFFQRISGQKPITRKKQKLTPFMKAALEDTDVKDMLKSMQLNNPAMQAAIIKAATGVSIEPGQIGTATVTEQFEQALAAKAMKALTNDEEYAQEAMAVMLDKVSKGRRGFGFMPRNQSEEEFDPTMYGGMGGIMGGMTGNPLDMIEAVESMKERLGGNRGGMFSDAINSAVGVELVKAFVPLLTGRQQPAPSNGNSAPKQPPQTRVIVVEIDNELVEMTPQGYQIYRKQREQLRLAEGKKAQEPVQDNENHQPEPTDSNESRQGPAVTVVNTPDILDETDEMPEEENGAVDLTKFKGPILELGQRLSRAIDLLEPVEFVQNLQTDAATGDPSAVLVFETLKNTDYDTAIGYLVQFDGDEDFVEILEKVRQNDEWVRESLLMLNQLKEE